MNLLTCSRVLVKIRSRALKWDRAIDQHNEMLRSSMSSFKKIELVAEIKLIASGIFWFLEIIKMSANHKLLSIIYKIIIIFIK